IETVNQPHAQATTTSVLPVAKRGKIVWLLGGGCGALALLLVVGVIGLMALFGSRSGPAGQAKATMASAVTGKDGGEIIPPAPPTNWNVLYRSDDPKIWNDDINKGPNHFAKALELVPDNIRYLKMTNMQNKEFVIVEMTKMRLTQVDGGDVRYGW